MPISKLTVLLDDVMHFWPIYQVTLNISAKRYRYIPIRAIWSLRSTADAIRWMDKRDE